MLCKRQRTEAWKAEEAWKAAEEAAKAAEAAAKAEAEAEAAAKAEAEAAAKAAEKAAKAEAEAKAKADEGAKARAKAEVAKAEAAQIAAEVGAQWNDELRDQMKAAAQEDSKWNEYMKLSAIQGAYFDKLCITLENTPMSSKRFKKDAMDSLMHCMRYEWEYKDTEDIERECRQITNTCRIKSDIGALMGFSAWNDLWQANKSFEDDHVEQFAYEMADKSPTLDEYHARLDAIMSALRKVPAVRPGADDKIVVYLEPPMRALGD